MRQHIVTIRFGPEDDANLLFLSELWKKENNSETIRQALQLTVQRIKEEEPPLSKMQILKESDFVGSFEGDKDLSIEYKKNLRDTLKNR